MSIIMKHKIDIMVKNIILITCLLLSPNIFAKGIVVPNVGGTHVYSVCVSGYLFAVATSVNGISITQIFQQVRDTSRPQPVSC